MRLNLRHTKSSLWQSVKGFMRDFLNVSKAENKQLSEKFEFLLKYNEECTTDDFCWAAITIFDHWLYETDSFHIISDATDSQKLIWDNDIKEFLAKLVDLEKPLKYKYIGRNSKQKLQFSRFIKHADIGTYVADLFNDVYIANLVFPILGIDLWFEDNWTIHFKYRNQEDCLEMLRLASELELFILPAYSADHLNDYENLSTYMRENGLGKSVQKMTHIMD